MGTKGSQVGCSRPARRRESLGRWLCQTEVGFDQGPKEEGGFARQ